MNCDQAFDQLTNPWLKQRDPLERHLRECPRCRHMQETLEPALAFFNRDVQSADAPIAETSANVEDRLSLEVRGWSQVCVSAEALDVAERAAARLAVSPASFRVRARQYFAGAMRYAAVFVLGSVMAWSIGSASHPSTEPVLSSPPAHSAVPCIRKAVANANPRAASADSKTVVLSCMTCHLPAP